jgi:non-ribosomal peptide synthetase-like protein
MYIDNASKGVSYIRKFLDYIIQSAFITTSLTIVTFAFYSFVLGLSLVPSFYVVYNATVWLLSEVNMVRILIYCFLLPCAMYVFFFSAAIIFGIFERIITHGIKPGKYPPSSITFVRWLINGGLHTVALNTFLPFIQGTAIFKLFLRLCGCKIGKNVFINTKSLHDVFLLRLCDDVVIGGDTDITCHMFENGKIVLGNIEIGEGTLIGASVKIGPGTDIGKNCSIGINSYIRRGKEIKDNSILISLPAIPIRDAVRLMNKKD